MRIKRRLIVVCALTAIGALAAASSAMATSNASSSATAKFCLTPGAGCKFNNHGTFKNGKLTVHTHTDYSVGGTKTDRAQLYFDNQLKFTTSAVSKCSANLAGLTMAQAMAACGSSLIGTGVAKATAATPQDTNACVLAFNAKDANPNVGGDQQGIALVTRAGIIQPLSYLNNCDDPANNTTGDATVLLQAPLSVTTNQNPGPVYKTSTGSPTNKGMNLDFANIATASAFPLNDFNVTTGAGAPKTNLTGTKAKFIQARCLNPSTRPTAYKKKLALRTKFTYTAGTPIGETTETKPYQSCT